MSETLAAELGMARVVIESILECLSNSPQGNYLLNAEAIQRLLEILTSASKTPSGLKKVTDVLGMVSLHEGLISQLASDGRSLSAILEQMVISATSTSIGAKMDQKMIVVAFDLLGMSDMLKSQLCMTIHEHVLAAIERRSLHPAIESKALELLVSTVTHHQENRDFFINNTPKERIRAVMELLTRTGNPMTQIFAVEFLWRIVPPTALTPAEKTELIGPMADHLFTITAQNFRAGILRFVEVVNENRLDPDRIYQFKVNQLMIGGVGASHWHTVYVGKGTILIWVNKEAEFSDGKSINVELVCLAQYDILGVGRSDKMLYIRISSEFNTLPSFFDNTSKLIAFLPIADNNEIYDAMVHRFGLFTIPSLPELRQRTILPITQTTISKKKSPPSPSKKPNGSSLTPKLAPIQPKASRISPQTPTSTRQAPKKLMRSDSSSDGGEDISSDSESEPTRRLTPPSSRSPKRSNPPPEVHGKKRSPKRASDPPEKPPPPPHSPQMKPPPPPRSPQPKPTQPKPAPQEMPKVRTKSPKQAQPTEVEPPEPTTTDRRSRNVESHAIPLTRDDPIPHDTRGASSDLRRAREGTEPSPKRAPHVQAAPEAIPALNISESLPFDDTSDASEPLTPEPVRQTRRVPQVEVVVHRLPPKCTAPPKRREYAPEKWELDTFDELKSFGGVIKAKLSERHAMLNRVIEDSVSGSLKDVTDFMAKCDSELDHLRNDFIMSSAQIAKDIAQKQKMVGELGSQQSEHIGQMMKECDVIQKRVEDLLRRFTQQKKTLSANQEKHIALFREDMLSEVKAAVTKGKRESSKQMVQKLVTLLDEL
jgi:hypothetical protein